MRSNAQELISNSALIIDQFGDWPSFHDAEIIRLEIARRGPVVLSMDVYLFASPGTLDEHGFFTRLKPSIATIVFRKIQNLSLVDFNEQNVLQEMGLSRHDNGLIGVEIFSAYGLSGTFSCAEVEVISVKPAKEVDGTIEYDEP